MKIYLLIFSLLASISLASSACSSISTENLIFDETSSGKEAVVPLNDSFKISLEANTISGYSWNEKFTIDKELVIEQLDYQYEAPIPAIPGIGSQIWTFEAVGIGKATITNEYGGVDIGSQNTKSFTLFVDVK
jgi:predicted secreted protein